MKRNRRTPLPLTTILFIASAIRVYAEDAGAVSPNQLQAKLNYCETCHGIDGQGFRGAYSMPRLAGQQPEYLENQLQAFADRSRINPVMFDVAHVLSPDMMKHLSADFKALNPKPLGGAPKELVSAGKKIYEEGVAESNIPPCASCHGADAKGNGTIPRLAGQLYEYTSKALANWSKEREQNRSKPGTSAIMAPIAHGLTAEQISAVAAYVSYLE
jgi:cytochrome c553